MEHTGTHKRIYGLDILRAFAISFVMLSHGYVYSGRIVDFKNYWWLTLDGVGLFFVLSGFLVGGILIRTIREKAFTIRKLFRFWIRRWFRTLPNYYLVLGVLVVFYYTAHHQLPPKLFQYITFTQCFGWPHPLFFGEAWSLAVEEWFYLLIPAGLFLVLCFAKNSRRNILLWILFVLLAVTLMRVMKVSQHDYFADGSFGAAVSKVVLTRLDGIMYGMLGAWLSIYRPQQWVKHKKLLFALGLILLIGSRIAIGYSLFFYGYFYFSVAAVGTLCLLPMLGSLSGGRGVVHRAFTFISIISYSMYLVNHMIVLRGIMPRLLLRLHVDPAAGMLQSFIALVLFWALTIIISYLLYRFWEQPVMRLRDKIMPSARDQ